MSQHSREVGRLPRFDIHMNLVLLVGPSLTESWNSAPLQACTAALFMSDNYVPKWQPSRCGMLLRTAGR